MTTRPPHLVRAKTRIPALHHTVIARERVVRVLAAAAEDRRVLQVVAPAGSGKTTAVVQFLATRPGPAGWLTLGSEDGSPGRLVTYLGAAAEPIDARVPELVARVLAERLPHADCAALVAERLTPGSTLVVDDVHLVEARPAAVGVLRALAEAVPDGALVVFISRRLLNLDLTRLALAHVVGAVSGDDLAFTEGEIGTLLAIHDLDGSPHEIAESSGGWAAGLVFDALRGGPSPAVGDADDPFFDYLGAEVLAGLGADLRKAVVRSAVLDIVEPRGLAAVLGVPSAERRYAAIRRHHLPATQEPEGLRYHPRFREFLLCLLREDPAGFAKVLVRHGRHLREIGQLEEAADRLLEAGARDEAADAVELVGGAVLDRGDWEKGAAWCEALGEDVLRTRPALRGVQLRAVLNGRREELVALVERLVATGEYDALVTENPGAATLAAFGMHYAGDWGAVARLLPPDEASPDARACRYVLEVGSGQDPPRPWPLEEASAHGGLVGLLACGLFFQGRFDEVLALTRAGGPLVPADHGSDVLVWRVTTLCEQGRPGDARALLEDTRAWITRSGFDDFWHFAEAELAFAEGAHEDGLRRMRAARALARRHGHVAADRANFAAAEGRMLVRMGRAGEAEAVLRPALAWCGDHGLPGFGEWAATWLAAARLVADADPAEAVALLEPAVAGMRRAERHLELPAAQAFLAEAYWRLDVEDLHDRAAAGAVDAAEAMATYAPLLAALAIVPGVLSRMIDAGGAGAARWRDLARAGERADTPTDTARTPVVVGTLGRLRLVVNGREAELSPPRAVDVAAAIARAGRAGIARDRLVEWLAPHSADPHTYLRQMVLRLRRVLPDGVTLRSEDGRLRWEPPASVVTEDGMLRSLVARARRETSHDRLETLGSALDLAARGPLASALDTSDAAERAAELGALVAAARRDQAELLLRSGRSAEAVAAARAAVDDEPLREDGWRLLMRAAAAASGSSAAVPIYRECAAALAEIGLAPSEATRTLLERMRQADPAPLSAQG